MKPLNVSFHPGHEYRHRYGGWIYPLLGMVIDVAFKADLANLAILEAL